MRFPAGIRRQGNHRKANLTDRAAMIWGVHDRIGSFESLELSRHTYFIRFNSSVSFWMSSSCFCILFEISLRPCLSSSTNAVNWISFSSCRLFFNDCVATTLTKGRMRWRKVKYAEKAKLRWRKAKCTTQAQLQHNCVELKKEKNRNWNFQKRLLLKFWYVLALWSNLENNR